MMKKRWSTQSICQYCGQDISTKYKAIHNELEEVRKQLHDRIFVKRLMCDWPHISPLSNADIDFLAFGTYSRKCVEELFGIPNLKLPAL